MKKGIELSLNFIVTIIIAITIFIFGVRFIYNLGEEATGLRDITFEELDRRIEDLLCETSDKVCIGIEKKVIKKGKFDFFGIRIINVLDARDFEISIAPSEPLGFTKANEPISGESKIAVKHRERVRIERNAEENIGVGFEVPKNTQSGTYIFNVAVCYDDGEGTITTEECTDTYTSPDLYGSLNKIYVEVP